MSVVIQDILRVFIIRIAYLNLDYASLLVKPIISWISHRLSEPSTLSDVDADKVNSNGCFYSVFGSFHLICPLMIMCFCVCYILYRFIDYLSFLPSCWSIQMLRYTSYFKSNSCVFSVESRVYLILVIPFTATIVERGWVSNAHKCAGEVY